MRLKQNRGWLSQAASWAVKVLGIRCKGKMQVQSHTALASLLATAGVSLLIPGFQDAVLGLLNKAFDLGLSLDTPMPWLIGLILVAAALAIYLTGEHRQRKADERAAAAPAGTFVAVRHHSFEPLSGRLPDEAVPAHLGRRTIRHLEWDQALFFASTTPAPASAVNQLTRLAADLTALHRADPDAVVGYYGIVHIPLQFLAGCSVSTWPKVVLFELDRSTRRWRELSQGKGPDLGLTVETVARPTNPTAVVIRIAVSYDVPAADAADVVAGPFEDVRISIANPRIDVVTHYGQVEALCEAFRRVLDDLHPRIDKTKLVHVFYAGPVSLGFSLGRRISRTIHHRTIVYNYTARTAPHYAWGIEVNSDPASPAEALVVRPVSLAGNSTITVIS